MTGTAAPRARAVIISEARQEAGASLFLLAPTCPLWKEHTLHGPHLRSAALCSALRGESICVNNVQLFCMGELSLLPSYMHAGMYVCMCACMCSCVHAHTPVGVHACMCSYVHAHMSVGVRACMCEHVHTHVCVDVHAWRRACVHACTCGCTHVYVCVCACMHVCMHMCAHMRVHACMCARTCAHMCAHACMCVCKCAACMCMCVHVLMCSLWGEAFVILRAITQRCFMFLATLIPLWSWGAPSVGFSVPLTHPCHFLFACFEYVCMFWHDKFLWSYLVYLQLQP